MATIVVPKVIQAFDLDRPLIFLAGPIRGGGDWQHQMAEELIGQCNDVQIACPSRWPAEHPLAEYFTMPFSPAANRQLHWERHYMETAGLRHGIKGCVLFWLGLEDSDNPHPGPEPYAMDTRRELGKFTAFLTTYNARIAVGGNPEFYGLSVIRDELDDARNTAFPFYENMRDLATNALEVAHRAKG